MDVDMEQDDYLSPKVEVNDSVSDKDPKDELLKILDKVEALVEELRRESFRMEERKDTLFTTLDAIRNSFQLQSLSDMDKDDIKRYLERVTARCQTVDITVRTDRDQHQEEALYQVNKYIDNLVISFKIDPDSTMVRCESFLAACKDSPEVLLVFHEKKIPFTPKFVNIANGEQYQQWYLEVNPRGEVPTIKVKNQYIPDSLKIIDYLEENYSEGDYIKLAPSDQGDAIIEKHNRLHKLIHDLPAEIVTIGSFYHPEFVGRPKLPFIYPARRYWRSVTEKNPEKLRVLAEKSSENIKRILLEKAEEADSTLKLMQNKDSFVQVLNRVDEVLSEVEEQLKKNEDKVDHWLFSDKFTLADVDLAILLLRINVLGLEGRFWAGGKRPNLQTFFDNARKRESFKKSIPSIMFHVKSMVKGITYLF